jgi:hypothetical protein
MAGFENEREKAVEKDSGLGGFEVSLNYLMAPIYEFRSWDQKGV